MKIPRKRKKQLKKYLKFVINGKRLNSKYIRITGVGQYHIITP